MTLMMVHESYCYLRLAFSLICLCPHLSASMSPLFFFFGVTKSSASWGQAGNEGNQLAVGQGKPQDVPRAVATQSLLRMDYGHVRMQVRCWLMSWPFQEMLKISWSFNAGGHFFKMSQRMWAASRSWKGKEWTLPKSLQKESAQWDWLWTLTSRAVVE